VRITDFSLSRLPRIEFGSGALAKLPGIARGYGTHVLLVTGAGSLKGSPFWPAVTTGLNKQGMSWLQLAIPGEPSPQMVDEAVRALHAESIDVVVGIGGGSALDAAKAIAGLLKPGNSVMDHLEGVGPELPYAGPATPFIAVPTTAGTGSEATKNAVLRCGNGRLQEVLPRRQTGSRIRPGHLFFVPARPPLLPQRRMPSPSFWNPLFPAGPPRSPTRSPGAA
jgi:alcohol dehydrogenase